MGDRTLLSLRALCKIYLILAKKIEYEGEIENIKNQILVKGEALSAHILNQTRIVCKFAQPHFREGMVSDSIGETFRLYWFILTPLVF
jgi:hypothetical protein